MNIRKEQKMYYQINEKKAKQSQEMMSYIDYKEGSATSGYRKVVDDIVMYAEEQKKRVNNKEAIDRIDKLVEKFIEKYADWTNRYYEILCYCPSIMITGGGNFPTKKKEKQNSMMDKHFEEYNKLMSIKNKIHSIVNGSYIIKSRDENVIEELEQKILKKENHQKEMKEVNAYYKKHKTMKGYKNLSDEKAKKIDEQIKGSCSWQQKPYPSYLLSNNNQEIHRLKKRLQEIKKAKEIPNQVSENEYFKIVRNSEIMRLQLFFDEIPDTEIRMILKRNGFKWSGKNEAWQRHLNTNSEYALKYVLEELEKKGI